MSHSQGLTNQVYCGRAWLSTIIQSYSSKDVSAKIDIVADQTFYDLSDTAVDSSSNTLEANKVYRVDFMDSSGDYIKIPRLLDGETLVFDIDFFFIYLSTCTIFWAM